MNFEDKYFVYLCCHRPLRMCIQCFLSVSRFCNQQRHLHHQQLGCICIAFLMPFLSGRQATVLQFELCVGLLPENVLTPRSGSYERNLNEQLSTGCLMQAWHTETFFLHSGMFGRDVSHDHLHVFKVVNPSLGVALPHFSQCLVLVGSRPQYLPATEELCHVFVHVTQQR